MQIKLFLIPALTILFIVMVLLISPPIVGGAYSLNESTATSSIQCPQNTPNPTEENFTNEYIYHCIDCVLALTPTGTPSDFELQMTRLASTQEVYNATSTQSAQLTATYNPSYVPESTQTPTNEPTIINTPSPSTWYPTPYCQVLEAYTSGNAQDHWTTGTPIEIPIPSNNVMVGFIYGFKYVYGPTGSFPAKTMAKAELSYNYDPLNFGWLYFDQNTIWASSGISVAKAKYDPSYISEVEMHTIAEDNEMGVNNYSVNSGVIKSSGSMAFRGRVSVKNYYNADYSGGMFCMIPIFYGSQESPEPTPEPTITPTIDPYYYDCSTWDYEEKTQVVTIGEITWTNGECITLLPGETLELPGELDPIGWDTVRVCPVYVDLPEMSIFGIEIPLSMLALPFVIWIIKLLMRI
jgi:hypothetical protein